MRVLIADDEPVSLQRLELAVSCIPEATLVAAAKNGAEALALIREARPDVAVLDIQMPGKSGIEVLASLRDYDAVPEVIFVTAFERHAIHAFELMAVDYLLKPVAFERFREAIRRAQNRLNARKADERFAELQGVIAALKREDTPLDKVGFERELWVRLREGLTRLSVESIDYMHAEGDYVSLHVGAESYLIRDTIASLNTRLNPHMFLRVHRSSIVNLARVKGMRRRGKRAYSVVLNSGAMVDVGPSFNEAVLKGVKARRWRGAAYT